MVSQSSTHPTNERHHNGTSYQYLRDLRSDRQSRGPQRRDLPIDPTETPFASGIEKESLRGGARMANPGAGRRQHRQCAARGDDAIADATTSTVRLGNVCRIAQDARVTGTQRRRACRPRRRDGLSEMLKGLGSSATWRRSWSAPTRPRPPATTHRPHHRPVCPGSRPIPARAPAARSAAALGANTRTDGTQRLFTEANLKTVLQSVWNRRKPDVIMTGGFNKQVFSTFTGRATPTEDTKARRSWRSRRLQSDFGTLRIALTASCGRATCWRCRWTCGRSPIQRARFVSFRSPRPAIRIGRRSCPVHARGPQRESLRRRVRQYDVVGSFARRIQAPTCRPREGGIVSAALPGLLDP